MTDPDPRPADAPSTSTADPDHEPSSAASRRTLMTALATVVALLVGIGLAMVISTMVRSDDAAAAAPAEDSAAVGLTQDMIHHHEQGVEMSTIVLENGTDPQVRDLAVQILAVQSNEIGHMEAWLTAWGYPHAGTDTSMAWMGHGAAGSGHEAHEGHGAHTGSALPSSPAASPAAGAESPAMPGMATESEMERLRALRGPEADIYFVQLMLRHHEGGLPMMDHAMNPDNVSEGDVRELATEMRETQDAEIALMETMLAERNAQPLPMN
ncbi:DUF305 domain-containing protein [Gordonia sp. LSe1-13]|uniref:DUF305 domain-containing protein n=1 Tax=Gordonia sesuvii TaxID=3116777 RepID=A0ABU7M7I1_9ACTN|nr:DUF305 domain-containing protein [Gordonia sp. LSe1-13]